VPWLSAAAARYNGSCLAAIVADFEASNSAPEEVPPGITLSPSVEKENRRSSSLEIKAGDAPGGRTDDCHEQEEEEEEEKVDATIEIDGSPSKDSSASSGVPDLSSPKSSPFRQSLDEEHRAKTML